MSKLMFNFSRDTLRGWHVITSKREFSAERRYSDCRARLNMKFYLQLTLYPGKNVTKYIKENERGEIDFWYQSFNRVIIFYIVLSFCSSKV